MASILKIGNKWRVQIRNKEFVRPLTKTFQNYEDAVAWSELVRKRADRATLPTDISNLERYSPHQSSGVYFLFDRLSCVYVGQSMNVHCRVKAHIGRIPFDSYSWVHVLPEKLDEVETMYIKSILPLYNVQANYEKAKSLGWSRKREAKYKSDATDLLQIG